MGDIRDTLNLRLVSLKDKVRSTNAEMWVEGGASPGSESYERSARLIEELHQVEAILAQMQLADAQRDVAAAQREVAGAQREATAANEKERAWSEGRAFWLRRFVSSLAVAFGAVSFATISALLRPDPPMATQQQVNWTLGLFLVGTVLTGAILPLLLAWKPSSSDGDPGSRAVQKITLSIALLSAVLLLCGTTIVVRIGAMTFKQHTAEAASAKNSNGTSVVKKPK